MLFALAFLPMFGIGGLTGLPLGLAATDIPLHDTNYVVGHFHYVVAPGTLLAHDVIKLNVPMSYAAFALGVFQIFFVANVFGSSRFGRRVNGNPWSATTLEWASGAEPERAYRDPYEYSVAGAVLDYVPQNERTGASQS